MKSFTIHKCDKNSTLLGEASTLKQAIKLANELLDSTLDNFVQSNGKIICFSDGILSDETPEPAWMRTGSVLTGREME